MVLDFEIMGVTAPESGGCRYISKGYAYGSRNDGAEALVFFAALPRQ